jgi:hypothetical protein
VASPINPSSTVTTNIHKRPPDSECPTEIVARNALRTPTSHETPENSLKKRKINQLKVTTPPTRKRVLKPPQIIQNRSAISDSAITEVPKSINKNKKLETDKGLFNLRLLGSGNFNNAYIITNKTSIFIDGLENSKIVIKCFKNLQIETNAHLLGKYILHQLTQYHCLQSTELPHTPILNNPIKDHYIVTLFIPNEIPNAFFENLQNNNEAEYEDLDNQSKNILSQLKNFVTYAINNNIALNLRPNNFRLDENYKVYLVDFKENDDDDDGVIPYVKCALKKWCAGNYKIYCFLTSDIKDEDKATALHHSSTRSYLTSNLV